MKAKILPLEGKYYGTNIEIETKKGNTSIDVWFMGDGVPSERELKANGITLEEFSTGVLNNPVEDCNGTKTTRVRDVYEICDSHYETQDGYNLCQIICGAINRSGK